MPRTPWPWETEAEAAEKAAAFSAAAERSRRIAARLASPLAEFKEMDAAYQETDDKQYAIRRDVAVRKEGMRAFTKAREQLSGRLADDRNRRMDLMRKLKMEPFRREE